MPKFFTLQHMPEIYSYPNESKNVLSKDVSIEGSLRFTKDLVVDGNITGEVLSGGDLTIGTNAKINGEIRTKSVTVHGTIDGNITVVEKCVLKSTADLRGDVSAGMLSIEEGASFSGRSTIGKFRDLKPSPTS
jgi:cytoskeletal protein CcmA (bactofilin family)